jgi:hypothetical protein
MPMKAFVAGRAFDDQLLTRDRAVARLPIAEATPQSEE